LNQRLSDFHTGDGGGGIVPDEKDISLIALMLRLP
jgi:hypothetical protein